MYLILRAIHCFNRSQQREHLNWPSELQAPQGTDKQGESAIKTTGRRSFIV